MPARIDGESSRSRALQFAPRTYHATRSRPVCSRRQRDEILKPEIVRVQQSNCDGVYGAKKVWKQLNRENIHVAHCTGINSGRYRINHGRHRQLNAAIYRTVIVRMQFHQPTIEYVARRTTEGKSKKDIIRCLKRYVIHEVYHLVKPAENTIQIAA